MSQEHWEELLEALLEDKNPCNLCAVKVMCRKSFSTKSGGGCPELKEAIKEALQRYYFENKNNET